MSMKERMARVIADAQTHRPYELFDYSAYPGQRPPHVVRDRTSDSVVFRSADAAEAVREYERLTNVYAATAILRAMQDPTEGMVDAAHDALAGDGDVGTVYQAMIQAALEGK